MNATLSPTIPLKRRPKPAPPQSVRAKMRSALLLIVEDHYTKTDAAREAGVSVAGLYKATARPDVQQYMEALNAWHIEQADILKARYRADAIRHGYKLMKEAKSEAVQARMVEFFARDPESGSPSITINNTVNSGPVGYEYVPPGANLVRIDQPSIVEDAETIDDQ